MRLMVGRNRLAKQRRQHVGQHGGRVTVRSRHSDLLALHRRRESLGQFGDDRIRDACRIDRSNRRRTFGVAANGQSASEDAGGDAFRFGAAEAEAAEADRIVGSDVAGGDSDQLGLRRDNYFFSFFATRGGRQERSQSTHPNDEPAHASLIPQVSPYLALKDVGRIGIGGAKSFGIADAAGRAAIGGERFFGPLGRLWLGGIVFLAANEGH